jgi:hypothetical protein
LLQLMNLVRATPDVRAELLQEISQRLGAGDYLTPAATDRTVEVILSSGAL